MNGASPPSPNLTQNSGFAGSSFASAQKHGAGATTARVPANIPTPSIATPVETKTAKYSVWQDIPLEAARR